MTNLSIIIPVYNEEAIINDLVQHLSFQCTEQDEIFIVDGAPGLGTLQALRSPSPVHLASLPGRARQMNVGAEHATGDILVFLHADTHLPSRWRELIVGVAHDVSFKAGAFDLTIDSPRFLFQLMASTANFRTHYTRVPYGDQVLFFDASYFRSLGGFAPIALMEDVELMTRIRKRGDRILLLDTPVGTSARRWEKEGILKGMLRNWLLRLRYHMGEHPEILAKMYRLQSSSGG